jgi:thermostable 8-oxoguanine DNA glycosylase
VRGQRGGSFGLLDHCQPVMRSVSLTMKEKMTTKSIKKIETKDELYAEDFKYDYNPHLTKILDGIKDGFDQEIINMIVLWKVNRYPYIPEDVLAELNEIRNDTAIMKHHEELVLRLLDCKGIQLPMASTFLRFRNPSLFQIIDQHVYRLLTGTELSLPVYLSEKNKKSICETYFDYLKVLRTKCKDLGIPFEKADRILYNADKRINKGVKLRNYGG